MNFSEAADVMRSNGWLLLTPRPFQDAVLRRSQLQVVDAGATIYVVGAPPGGLYGLVSGSLGVAVAPGERGPYLAHFAQPGSWLGEGAILTGRPRQVGLFVTRASRLLHLPLHDLQDILATDSTAWRWLAVLTSLHLDVAMGAADDLMLRDHVKRFIAVLLRLAGRRQPGPHGDKPEDVHVNQEEIAHMANVARTTAGSILRSLEEAGLVDLAYRSIKVLDPAALRIRLAED